MRTIGQYKGAGIKITNMYLSDTYGEFLLGPSANRLEESNRRLVDVDAPKMIVKLWGDNRAYHLMEVNYKKELPSTRGIAWLECSQTVKNADDDGSSLIIIWYQNPDNDPFQEVADNLKQLSWQDEAKDFKY